MPNNAKTTYSGYRCTVKGCPKKNSLFGALGIAMHTIDVHGIKVFEDRMRVKVILRSQMKRRQ